MAIVFFDPTVPKYYGLIEGMVQSLNLAELPVAWADVSKVSSSLADLATRSVANLSDGTNVPKLDTVNIFTGNGTHGFIGNINSDHGLRFRNTNAGSGARCIFTLANDVNNDAAQILMYSSTWAGSGLENKPSSLHVRAVIGHLTLSALPATGEIYFGTGGNIERQRMDAAGNLRPAADNTMSIGLAATRYNLIRGVTITPGDLSFENEFTLTEHDKVGIVEPGIALLAPDGELVAFFGKSQFRAKGLTGLLNIDDLTYVRTTVIERSEMDNKPHERVTVDYVPLLDNRGNPILDEDDNPIIRTVERPKRVDEVRPMPDPSTGRSNNDPRTGT